jgi:probable rRNA maturation factor
MSQTETMHASSNTLPGLELAVEVPGWPDQRVLERWFDAALAVAVPATNLNLKHGEISLVLTNDAAMQTINAQHRGQDKPTNVLSFPAMDPGALDRLTGNRPFLLGDLVFALETVEREAQAGRLSLHHHMSHLFVHGFLHLVGYDHEQADEAEAMEALETRLLATLGIADPYRQHAPLG